MTPAVGTAQILGYLDVLECSFYTEEQEAAALSSFVELWMVSMKNEQDVELNFRIALHNSLKSA